MKHVHDTFKVLQFSFHPNHCIHCNYFYLFVYDQTRSPQHEHTHSAEHRSIKTDKTQRSTRHWSRQNHRVADTFCNCIEDRTI